MYSRPELIPFNWVPGYITITLCISWTLHGDSITYRSHQIITFQARINMCDLMPYITFFLVLKPVSNHQLSACIYVHEGCCTYHWFHKCKENGNHMLYHSISISLSTFPHNPRLNQHCLVVQYTRKWNKRLTHRPIAIVARFWDPCINQSTNKVCLHLHSSTTEEILVI